MGTLRVTSDEHKQQTNASDRRQFDRALEIAGQNVSAAEEISRLRNLLERSERHMAFLRRANMSLMAVNSDLRLQLGEITLKWLDTQDNDMRLSRTALHSAFTARLSRVARSTNRNGNAEVNAEADVPPTG